MCSGTLASSSAGLVSDSNNPAWETNEIKRISVVFETEIICDLQISLLHNDGKNVKLVSASAPQWSR